MATLSTNDLLLGIGLVLALAVGSQLLAKLLRLPAIVVLLPVGFVAGILTEDVRPSALLGARYQPFVSVAVGVILFEEVTDVLLLSRSDDFNALAASELRGDLGHGHVYRIAPEPDQPDLLPPASQADILGHDDLTLAEFTRRLEQGERFTHATVDRPAPAVLAQDGTVLFVVDPNGGMRAATDGRLPTMRNGDTTIKLVDPVQNQP